MILPASLRIVFKSISALTAGIFLWNQVAWAGDLIDLAINKQANEQAQTFAPAYLQNQQSVQTSLISSKNDIENFNLTQSASTNNSAIQEQPALDLQGPRGGGGGDSAIQSLYSNLIQELPDEDGSPVFSITTKDGDVIYYKGGKIDRVEKKDGTIIKVLRFENDQLLDAEITFPDGTVEVIVNGKVTKITRPDGVVFYYDDDERVKYVLYPDADETDDIPEVVSFFEYTIVEGNVTKTTVRDYNEGSYTIDGATITLIEPQTPEKTAEYDADGKLAKVTFKDGKVIEYTGGVLSRIIDSDGTTYNYDIQEDDEGSVVTLSDIVSSDRTIAGCVIDKDGKLTSGAIEYSDNTRFTIEGGRITKLFHNNDTLILNDYYSSGTKKYEIFFDATTGWESTIQYLEADGITPQNQWLADKDPLNTGDVTYAYYDDKGRVTLELFDDGSLATLAYYGDTTNKQYIAFYSSDYAWQKTVGYHEDGSTTEQMWASDTDALNTGDPVYCNYDDNGRLVFEVMDDNSFAAVQYWNDTPNKKYVIYFATDWSWQKTDGYREDGTTGAHIWMLDPDPSQTGDIIGYDYNDAGVPIYKILDTGECQELLTPPGDILGDVIFPVVPEVETALLGTSGISCDGKIVVINDKAVNLSQPLSIYSKDTKAYFNTIKYHADKDIKEVISPNGDIVEYENALPQGVTSGSGNTLYTFVPSGVDTIEKIIVQRANLTMTYDPITGELLSIGALGDELLFGDEAGDISFMVSGSMLTAPQFADNTITDGVFDKLDSDGNKIGSAVYEGGRLVSYIDASGNEYKYDASGNLIELKRKTDSGDIITYYYTSSVVTTAEVPSEERDALGADEVVLIKYENTPDSRRVIYLETKDGHYKEFGNGKRHRTPAPRSLKRIKRVGFNVFLGLKELFNSVRVYRSISSRRDRKKSVFKRKLRPRAIVQDRSYEYEPDPLP